MTNIQTMLTRLSVGLLLAAPLGYAPLMAAPAQEVSANPYLPLWEHLPDGEPRVFEDPDHPGKYRVYIIGSHDLRYSSYCGPDIRAWSAPVEDLNDWRDEGAIFTYFMDGKWDVMYAPDLVEIKRKDGKKEYYLYPHSRGHNRIGLVAKSSRPDGPFMPINVSDDGKRALAGSIFGFDPSVYIENIEDSQDADYATGFRAYGFWGFQHSNAAEIDPNTMYSLRPGKKVIDGFIPASHRYGVVKESEGTNFPSVFPGEDLGRFNFFEAASIRKVGNKYVWVYSGYSGPDYGLSSTNSALRYAYGDTPLGPWKSGGVLVDSRAPMPNQDGSALQTTYSGHNTHGSIEQMNGQWYVFYHRAPRGFGFARQPVVAPVSVEYDEASVADGGAVRIRAYDPYTQDNHWTAKDSQGHEYKGAEVTSEGFHIYGLDPYCYYSAGYACYLSDISLQQDSWDVWNNHMTIGNVKKGQVIGYKYFGFGGLDADSKGIKAFKGTEPGNKTQFNLFLAPQTDKEFVVEVWLDAPWNNSTWQGKKMGTIKVPANASKKTQCYTLDVSNIVDQLDKKHAIYLVADGASNTPLFDLMGLGFSTPKRPIAAPIVPQITITVDGKTVEMPQTPVRSTDENGLLDAAHYRAEIALSSSATAAPKVKAKSDVKGVKIDIRQAKSAQDIAVVECTYKGKTKTFEVAFTAGK